jgi:hypothetical protein
MLGIPMRSLLKHPAIGVADPIEPWTTIRESYVAERDRRIILKAPDFIDQGI